MGTMRREPLAGTTDEVQELHFECDVRTDEVPTMSKQ